MAVRADPRFRDAVRAWWSWLPLCNLPPEERVSDDERVMPVDQRGMTKPVYCAMAAIIQRALLPRFGLKPNPSYEPEEDWSYDCKGRRFLLFPQLHAALFELADMWCPTTGAEDYCVILLELLEQCKVLEARHGLFSKLLRKYQLRYGAREEHLLPISGGYVSEYDSSAGRALQGGGGGGGGGLGAMQMVPGGGGGGGGGGGSGGGAAAGDEADAVMKALSEDDDSEDHRATTDWWAKVMERNRRYMQARVSGLADAAAQAAASHSSCCSPAASAGPHHSPSRPATPLPFPMNLLSTLFALPPPPPPHPAVTAADDDEADEAESEPPSGDPQANGNGNGNGAGAAGGGGGGGGRVVGRGGRGGGGASSPPRSPHRLPRELDKGEKAAPPARWGKGQRA
ncbi:hypothetical protein Agub_g2634, partial [Astrephomene gubernaculifera]